MKGTWDCDNFDDCGFDYDGKKDKHMMFTETGVEVYLNTSLSISKCHLRVLAIGGGGTGLQRGGGSGYIQYLDLTPISTPTLIKLVVGRSYEASTVAIGNNLIKALPGRDRYDNWVESGWEESI